VPDNILHITLSLSPPREIMVQDYKKCYRRNIIYILNEKDLWMVVLGCCYSNRIECRHSFEQNLTRYYTTKADPTFRSAGLDECGCDRGMQELYEKQNGYASVRHILFILIELESIRLLAHQGPFYPKISAVNSRCVQSNHIKSTNHQTFTLPMSCR
jgi:hypothetical protein